MSRENKKPGRFLGPLVITGITAGVLYSAYKAIFKQPEHQTTFTDNDEGSNVETSGTHSHNAEPHKEVVESIEHTPANESLSHGDSKPSSDTTTNGNDSTNN